MKTRSTKLFNLFVVLSMALSILATPTLAAPIKADVQSAPAVPVAQEDADAKLTPALVEKFSAGAADFIVHFKEQADLSAAYQMDWEARGAYVYNTLKETAERSQAGAKAVLDGAGLRYQTFIAGNELYVWGGTLDTARAVAALPEVEYLRETRVYHIDPVIKGSDPLKSYAVPNATPVNREVESPTALAWGIDDTQADQFWSTFGFQGDGIVVANIDTGVDYTHDALEPNYKCGAGPHESCWLDPGTADCTGPGGGPCDTIYFGIYHGTHTMGTMVADDNPALLWQAGMAPNAQWIACLGCPFGSCPEFDLNTCADWMLAPGGDPNNRPNIVNNSWGGGGGDAWYLSKVNAWRAAGIFPAFSAGNSGPGCSTLGSPGDYQESFGSAAHDVNRVIADFSSRGPSFFGDNPYTKPNLSAPGVNVISTQPGDSWTSISGTSMASPHTAGAVALLWSCNPSLVGQIDQTFQILQGNTDAAPAGNCGAPPSGEGNYTYGYGYLNVYEAGLMWCGPTGTLTGSVTDAVTSAPIPSANIFADGGFDFNGTTNANGVYTMTVAADTYDVTASAFGYLPETATGVVVVEDGTTVQDFALTPAAAALVSGVVYDVNTGWPLYARIDIAGYPYGSIWTDPVTGYYEVSLPIGSSYDFTVSAWVPGYLPSTVSVPVAGPTTQDFPLDVDVATCVAPGYYYSISDLYLEDFEGGYGNWTFDGLWNPESQADVCGSQVAPFPSPTNAAYYGIDGVCTFDTGSTTTGSLTQVNPVALPADSAIWLSASSWSATECGGDCYYDKRYFEVSTDGVNFTNVGAVNFEYTWGEQTFDISQYAGQNVYLRFRFDSVDPIANYYFGWMLDNVKLQTAGCLPLPGGLVVGNVYDENTASAVNGADIWNDGGFSAVSQATPDDPNVDDGFFTVFSSPSAGGVNHYATKSGGYGIDQRTVPVPNGGTVEQDFFLPAGWISNDPGSLSVTLDFGQVETLPLTLTNLGALAASFEIREKDEGFTPAVSGKLEWLKRSETGVEMRVNRPGKREVSETAYPKALRWTPDAPSAMNVLVYADDYMHPAPNTYIDQALQSLGVAYTAHYEGDFIGFESDLVSGGPWDLVIFADENYGPPTSLDASLNNYVLGGGKLVFQTWTMWNFPLLASTLGVTYITDVYDPPAPVYWWDPGHPVFTDPESVPEYTNLTGGIYGIYGQYVEPYAGFAALAGYTTPGPDPNQAAMVLNEENTTIFKGFVDGSNDADLDGDGKADAFELWVNIISGIEVGFAGDVPWLSESPISGTLSGNFTPVLEYRQGDTTVAKPGEAVEVVGMEAPAASGEVTGAPSQPYAPTAVLYDNGPFVTNPGGGFGGADLSALQTALGMLTLGFGHQYSLGYRMADDFTVTDPEGWLIDKITFFAYQTGSTTASTITGVYLQIWDGPPNDAGSSVVWGDLTTNRLINTTWTGAYRATDAAPLGNTRPIMADTAKVGVALPPGTYWLDWMTDGTLPSGPWAPPVTILGQTTTGNALQYTGAWAPANDTGTLTQQGMPFVIEGSLYEPQMVVDVTFDAGVPEVGQPGEYKALLNIATDTPYGKLSVPVTMIVNAPATWGKLEGTVTSLGYCDANPVPAEGAVVVIEDSTGVTYTLETDASGYFTRWFDQAQSPFSISVTYPEHEKGEATGVVVTGGQTTTQDFDLRWLKPCISVDPTSYSVEVGLGYSLSRDLEIANAGAAATDFKISEKEGEFTPALGKAPASFSAPAAIGPMSVRSPEGRAALGPALAQSPLIWDAASPIPNGGQLRYAHAQCAEEPDSFYIISGVDASFSLTPDVYRYDSTTDTWTALAPFPAPQEGPSAACFEGYIYVVGGGGTNQFYIYDIANDSWAAGPALPRNVWGAAVGAWDGFVYVAGGDDDFFFGGTSSQLDIYDIANGVWSSGTPMPSAAVTAGSFQAGPYLFVVGGWNDASPASNSTATLRYEMGADIWEIGPEFTFAQADFSLAATETYLYAIGGDANGGGPFDMSNAVNWLDHTDFPAGSWSDAGDPLPVPLTANNAGFCTEGLTGGEVWTVGGVDNNFVASPGNYFRTSEACFKVVSDVPWLSENPITGTVDADSAASIEVTFTAMPTMSLGTYTALLKVRTKDPVAPSQEIPVTMVVVAPAYGVEAMLEDEALSGLPGQVVTYTLMVTNKSNGPVDSFDVEVSGNAWTTNAPTSVGPLAPDETAVVEITVEIPADANFGDEDMATCTLTSQGDPTKSAAVTMTTSVAEFFRVELAPASLAAGGTPGSMVAYELTLTNTGTAEDTIDLSATSAWAVTFPVSSFTLDAGESVTVVVHVAIPLSAAIGDSDVATITATSQGDPTATDSSELTTTAVMGKMFLPVIPQVYMAP